MGSGYYGRNNTAASAAAVNGYNSPVGWDKERYINDVQKEFGPPSLLLLCLRQTTATYQYSGFE